MKAYEILALAPNFMKTLHECGIKSEDYKWLGMYQEYRKMKGSGEKTSYAVAVLSARYRICERKVYKVIHDMERDCEIGAVR